MPEHFIPFNEAANDLLTCSAYLAERIKSREGHAEAMLAIVPLFLTNGKVDLAAELANTIEDPFTRDRLLILTAEKCAEIDDDEYALQLADAVEDDGLRGQARERVALVKAAKDEIQKARDIAEPLAHPDIVLTAIAVRQMSKDDETGAFKTLDEMEFLGERVSALMAMAVEKIGNGDNEKASALLEKAVESADQIEHEEEQITALCDIGNLYIEAKRNDRAIETFDKAKSKAETLDNVHRDRFLAFASLGFLHAGSLEQAEHTLDLVEDKTQIATCLLGYSREFWRKDEKDEALESLEEAYEVLKSQRDIETRSSKERFTLFTSIAAQFAGFEKGQRAIEIAEGIEDENQQMSALSQIAQIACFQKQDEVARQAIKSIADDAQRVFALIGMSSAADKNDDKEHAILLLKEAAELVESVPQMASRASAFNEIAKRLDAHNESEAADALYEKSLHLIPEIPDESSRAVALANFSQIAAEAGIELADSDRELLQEMMNKAGF